jgi:hypothetical protein
MSNLEQTCVPPITYTYLAAAERSPDLTSYGNVQFLPSVRRANSGTFTGTQGHHIGA